MLAQLSARLMASRAAGIQPGDILMQSEDGETGRLALGDDCSVM